MSTKEKKQTPLMAQYEAMKKKHPDAVLLFRVGDFYETFSDDAVTTSRILGITLTRRGNGSATSVPLAGFPHHALDTYLPKLVRAGKRVAICEQLEDPKTTKKLVKRGITELVTPGINTSESGMASTENNFLAGFHVNKKGNRVGLAFLDITTGEFMCAEGSPEYADKLLNTIAPKELLHIRGLKEYNRRHFHIDCSTYELDDWIYTLESATERLLKQFQIQTLKGFGIQELPLAQIAAGSLLHYLDLTGHSDTSHITSLGRIDENSYVHLDRFTQRNLELLCPLSANGKSLYDILNLTVTPMGARLLGQWIRFPLTDIKAINRRHEEVEAFFRMSDIRRGITDCLSRMGDLEKGAGAIGRRKVNPRMLMAIADGLESTTAISETLKTTEYPTLCSAANRFKDSKEIISLIRSTIATDPPGNTHTRGYIRNGVSAELDEYRRLVEHGNDGLREVLEREIRATGITSLKLGFNNVWGYYVEVRNTHKDKVPQEWIRKQTLTNGERYITSELKNLENRIINAQSNIDAEESRIYQQLIDMLEPFVPEILENARAAAHLDVILAFAQAAEEYSYVRPIVDDSMLLEIENGRHPVIERRLPPGEPYIANSVVLNPAKRQIMMITGPNMSGKSALLRQTALITLMAQMGCFVPAETAHIGMVDKVFTRVGASDNISEGESTFMVEMTEAAAILNNMSARSLILFDELGRGTSTYDGISIARAIVEHIHQNRHCHPKTLFATHYHELNEMEKDFPRIVNYNVSVKEIGGKVVFVRKLERGGSEHSFGIHVAKLAGMPKEIVRRADQILMKMEHDHRNPSEPEKNTYGKKISDKASSNNSDGIQLSLFELDDPLLAQIRDRLLDLDVNNLTPLMALTTLSDLQSLLTGK